MPTYSYRCTNPDCQHEQDFFHGINEGGTPRCAMCEQPMKRLLSAAPHRFMNPRGTMGVISGGKRSDISN